MPPKQSLHTHFHNLAQNSRTGNHDEQRGAVNETLVQIQSPDCGRTIVRPGTAASRLFRRLSAVPDNSSEAMFSPQNMWLVGRVTEPERPGEPLGRNWATYMERVSAPGTPGNSTQVQSVCGNTPGVHCPCLLSCCSPDVLCALQIAPGGWDEKGMSTSTSEDGSVLTVGLLRRDARAANERPPCRE